MFVDGGTAKDVEGGVDVFTSGASSNDVGSAATNQTADKAGADASAGLTRSNTNGAEATSTTWAAEDSGVVTPASPIATRVEELWTGPSEIRCEVENACAPNDCVLDTHACDGSFTIQSATDLDALAGCTSVSGNLVINASDLSSLAALQSLVTIGGDLTIEGCDSLTSLTGLDALVSIGGNLYVGDDQVQGSEGNSGLLNLAGLEQLAFVGGAIVIQDNPALTTLNGLRLVGLDGQLVIRRNGALTDLEALSSVTCLGGFGLQSSNLVTSLAGLDNLEQLGALYLSYDAGLSDLTALNEIEWIPGSVFFTGLDSLTNLQDLERLTGVGALDLSLNYQLTSFSGLDNLVVVRGDLRSTFDDFTGLGQLRAVGGVMFGFGRGVVGLDALEAAYVVRLSGDIDLWGFPDEALFGALVIEYNTLMEDLSAFSAVTVSEGLWLMANSNLQSLDGLHHTESFSLGIVLDSNERLASLEALDGLRFVAEQVFIVRNPALHDLRGLDDVEFTDGSVSVVESALVFDGGFTGFESLTTIGGRLHVDPAFDFRLLPQLESVGTLQLTYKTQFVDLMPFSHVTVERGLWVTNDYGLESLSGLRHDGHLEDTLEITGTEKLTDLSALRGVQTIDAVFIAGNESLTELSGLNDLVAVSEGVNVRLNAALQNLDGLEALTTVGGRLEITNNPLLENLDGLSQLMPLVNSPEGYAPSADVSVNVSLPQCAAEALVGRIVDPAHGKASGNDEASVCN